MLLTPRADVALKVNGALGEASLQEAVYAPILDLMADHKARTLGEMEAQLKERSKDQPIAFAQLLQAVMVLGGAGHFSAVQDDSAISKARNTSTAANQWLMSRARSSDDMTCLASPVTGGGVKVNRFQQLFLQSLQQGRKKPEEWAQSVWETIAAQGQRLI